MTDSQKILTVAWAQLEVERISDAAKTDDEEAHYIEDAARKTFLRALSEGRVPHPDKVASALLESADIEFARWCS